MPGWRDEADAEDIDGFAQHTVNNDGKREYESAYEGALRLHSAGTAADEIHRRLVQEPAPLQPDASGQVHMNRRKWFEANRRLAHIRKRAVTDALAGRPADDKDN